MIVSFYFFFLTDLTVQRRLSQVGVSGWVVVVLEVDARSCCSAFSPVCSEKQLCCEALHLTAGVQTGGPHIWL